MVDTMSWHLRFDTLTIVADSWVMTLYDTPDLTQLEQLDLKVVNSCLKKAGRQLNQPVQRSVDTVSPLRSCQSQRRKHRGKDLRSQTQRRFLRWLVGRQKARPVRALQPNSGDSLAAKNSWKHRKLWVRKTCHLLETGQTTLECDRTSSWSVKHQPTDVRWVRQIYELSPKKPLGTVWNDHFLSKFKAEQARSKAHPDHVRCRSSCKFPSSAHGKPRLKAQWIECSDVNSHIYSISQVNFQLSQSDKDHYEKKLPRKTSP